jgi:hypothetical protein
MGFGPPLNSNPAWRLASGGKPRTAKVAKNGKTRRGKGKWQSRERNAKNDVIPTGTKRSGGISQLLVTANWELVTARILRAAVSRQL